MDLSIYLSPFDSRIWITLASLLFISFAILAIGFIVFSSRSALIAKNIRIFEVRRTIPALCDYKGQNSKRKMLRYGKNFLYSAFSTLLSWEFQFFLRTMAGTGQWTHLVPAGHEIHPEQFSLFLLLSAL
jgi:hypothetical protein